MSELKQDQAIIVAEEKMLAEIVPDEARIQEIVTTIQINDPTSFLTYGSKPMSEIAKFSDTLLSRIKTKDAGEVGGQLSDLVLKIREYDPMSKEEKASGFLANIPVIGGLFRQVEKTKIDHTTLTSQVDIIASHLDNSMVGLLRDNEQLAQLYDKNLDYYRELNLYINAGKQFLGNIRTVELPALEAKANETKDMLDAQNVKDMLENINRFERRIHDLELSKMIAMQTAPQIRIIQSNNQQLAEKIQGSIFSTLPIWKSQIVLSLSLQEQEKAAKLQKDVSDTTNELLRKNAEMLQQNSIATAHEVERSIVDIETVREVQNRLVNTIEETMKIASEAREKRKTVEIELSQMENNLRERITEAVAKNQ